MTSLEGVWRIAVRTADLETSMLLSSRGWPLLTVANGPLLARRSCGAWAFTAPEAATAIWRICAS